MAAALTLLILLAGSLVIVRIASVALRLTGLPDHVARFQSISALTGAGFTTTESEAIVNFPIRRRIVVGLMILGNLGLVSVLSTFIIAFGERAGSADAMIRQGLTIVAVIAFILLVMTNKTLDRILCGVLARVLIGVLKFEQNHIKTVLALDKDYSIAEHVYRGPKDLPMQDVVPVSLGLNILSVRGSDQTHYDEFGRDFLVGQNETLICFGSEKNHHKLADHLAGKFPFHPAKSDI